METPAKNSPKDQLKIKTLKTIDFDYFLPHELIAQKPLENRENCRMLYINKHTDKIKDDFFYNIIDYLNKDDILVLNDTKVYPARLIAKRETGAQVEIFLLNPLKTLKTLKKPQNQKNNYWEALGKNLKRAKIGETLEVKPNESHLSQSNKTAVDDTFKIRLIEKIEAENESELPKYIVELIYDNSKNKDVFELLEKYGKIPLPPYIQRDAQASDTADYQTVFARNLGSVASPTAGLHFTRELLEKIEQKGIHIAYITLNVGLGTFLPVKTENIQDHTMHKESFVIPESTQELIQNKKQGASIIAVGTTVLRCLEAVYQKYGKITAGADETSIFIYPPYKIKSVDKLITNFHLPKSTLLMLVSAFCSQELIFRAYEHAIKEKYRFFSYGDCMFIDNKTT